MLNPDEYDIPETAARLCRLFEDRQVFSGRTFDLDDWKQRNAGLPHSEHLARPIFELRGGPGFDALEPEQAQDPALTVLHFLANEYGFEGGPDEVGAFLEGTFPLSIEDAVRFAAFLGCRVGDFSPYHQRRIDAVAQFSSVHDEAEQLHASLGAMEAHLEGIAGVLPFLLRRASPTITQQIVAGTRSALADVDSPEEFDGVANALDYLGVLLSEGADHELYQLGMDVLDSTILQQVKALTPYDQVAVLLPLCDQSRSVDTKTDLVLERDISVDDWAEVLRKQLWQGWTESLRNAVLATIPMRDRHA